MRTHVIQDGPAPEVSVQAPPRRRSLVARHPVATFFVLSYAIAWGFLPFGSSGAFAPLVAAVVVIGVAEGRSGFRRWGARMVPWRVGGRWYAAAVALPVRDTGRRRIAEPGAGSPCCRISDGSRRGTPSCCCSRSTS